MSKYVSIELKSGKTIEGNVIAKMVTSMVVRTVDNKYLLISRDTLVDPSQFKYSDEE